jgi:hypothetical protein
MNTLLSILISILLYFILLTNAICQTNTSFNIPLKSGTITLEKGDVDISLMKKMGIVTDEHQYAIVQFEHVLKRSKIIELEKRGVHVLSCLHENAWICSVMPSVLTETEMKKYSIAAVTPWKAEYKISPDLKNGHFQKWAVTENGNIKLLVSSFGDVDEKVMERLLAQYSSFYEISNVPNMWAVQLKPENIENLINEPVVHSVEEGPHPAEQRLMFCIGLALMSAQPRM